MPQRTRRALFAACLAVAAAVTSIVVLRVRLGAAEPSYTLDRILSLPPRTISSP